jgi:hypothetical protein
MASKKPSFFAPDYTTVMVRVRPAPVQPKMRETTAQVLPSPPKESEWGSIMNYLAYTAANEPRLPHGKAAKRAHAAMAAFEELAPAWEDPLRSLSLSWPGAHR